ncbi:MAG: YdcF family protein [Lewinellaceae bacterium]|nr:YdcF family protein [Saprospiraceae bacterium]MCB9337397.1 YdcF family protein [Lewinellaceae bacterium]
MRPLPTSILFVLVAFATISSCFSCYSSKKLEKIYREDLQKAPYDVIIVPGVPLENGEWSFTMKGRVCWSQYLYEKGYTKNIMYSGSAVYTPYTESHVMALYGAAIGIPPEHIFEEPKAEHSTENLYYGVERAHELGFKKIALASDPFQASLLRKFAKRRKKLGLSEVGFLPMQFDSLSAHICGDPDIPYQEAFVADFVSIVDREGFFKRFNGTLGRHVIKEDKEKRKAEKNGTDSLSLPNGVGGN